VTHEQTPVRKQFHAHGSATEKASSLRRRLVRATLKSPRELEVEFYVPFRDRRHQAPRNACQTKTLHVSDSNRGAVRRLEGLVRHCHLHHPMIANMAAYKFTIQVNHLTPNSDSFLVGRLIHGPTYTWVYAVKYRQHLMKDIAECTHSLDVLCSQFEVKHDGSESESEAATNAGATSSGCGGQLCPLTHTCPTHKCQSHTALLCQCQRWIYVAHSRSKPLMCWTHWYCENNKKLSYRRETARQLPTSREGGARPPSPLPLRPLWLHPCVWLNP